jgi:hypothetical protein
MLRRVGQRLTDFHPHRAAHDRLGQLFRPGDVKLANECRRLR